MPIQSARRCNALNTGLRKPEEARGAIGSGVAVILNIDCDTTRSAGQMKLRR
jgi:hypothetical protein